MSDTQKEKEDTRQWFLRINGETVFGPVSTQGLIVWAEQGRILPGHEVSTDRKKWTQAVSLDVLDMRGFVDDGEGELRGPLNRLAAEALITSGKVPENAQLVSADEVEPEASEAKGEAAGDKSAREQVPDDVLRVRVRELESMVNTLRERLSKLSDANALETVQQERDVLANLLREAEAQRETLLRNAEKDARTNERKLDGLRQQIKKLERQLEETNSRLLLSDQVAASQPEQIAKGEADRLVEAARSAALNDAKSELSVLVSSLQGEIGSLKSKGAIAEQALAEARSAFESLRGDCQLEKEAFAARLSELEKAIQFHERRAEETAQILATREAELELAQARVRACEQRAVQAEAEARAAEEKAREHEAAFVELLTDANARDNEYQNRIALLEKTSAQTPEETARFFADQSAVYELLKSEADELAKSLEMERAHAEQMKEWGVARQQSLAERRQALLKHLGSSPGEMTRRSVREQPSDPQTARLRAEFENLRVTRQREQLLAEERDRDLQAKLRVFEAENARLQGMAVDGEKVSRRVQELEDVLRRREHELSDERKNREAERDQFQSSQQTLLMRIESLEKSAKPVTPDEIQSSEARNVKLATWMRLKR